MTPRFGIYFLQRRQGQFMGFHFRIFAFEYALSFRIFYVTWYHIPDKGAVILYRILTDMNCTHTCNNLDFERRL